MKKTIDIDYDVTDIVYLRVATERYPGMVTCVQINVSGAVTYQVTFRDRCTCHYAEELCREFVPSFESD